MAKKSKSAAAQTISPKKSKSEKKAKASSKRNLKHYLTPVVLTIIVLPMLLAYVFYTQRLVPMATTALYEKNELIFNIFSRQLSSRLNILTDQIDALAQLPAVQKTLKTESDPKGLDPAAIPTGDIQNVVLIPNGKHRANTQGDLKISHIMISNAYNAMRTGESTFEFEDTLLYVVTDVTDASGQVLGAIIAQVPRFTILDSVKSSLQGSVAVEIIQAIEQVKSSVWQSEGWQTDGQIDQQQELTNRFKLQAQWRALPTQGFTAELALIGAALAASILGCLILLLSMALYQRVLNEDLQLMRELVIDLFKGKKVTKDQLKLANTTETFENICDNLRNMAALNPTSARHSADFMGQTLFGSSTAETGSAQTSHVAEPTYSREQYAMEVVETQRPSTTNSTASDSLKLDSSIFRAYDIRGIYPGQLNAHTVEAIGQAIGSDAASQGCREISIARDGRQSGPELLDALQAGLQKAGLLVVNVGMVPTPLLYFAAKSLTSGSGVMLTGSHNPKDYNGLKIMIDGVTLYGDRITQLYQRIKDNDLVEGKGQSTKKDIQTEYQQEFLKDIVLTRALKIVVDCGNGVTGMMLPELFEQLGVNATGLFTEVDGTFPNHAPDPSQPKNLTALIAAVKEQGADIGLAFDGDGDRVAVISNTGKVIYADQLMMLFSEDVLANNPGAQIIFDVKCSSDLAQVIENNGGRPLMWKTGHSLIKAKIRETNAPLAGEMSGHIFFSDRWNGFDDAMYAAARLLELLASTTDTLDQMLERFPKRVATPEIHIDVTEASKFDIIDRLVSSGDFGNGKVNHVDGLRVDYGNGWGLIRASNTTPVLVARFEAESEEVMQTIQGLFRRNINAAAPDVAVNF